MKKNKMLLFAFLVLSILFIWAQSTINKNASAAESGFFFELINRILPFVSHNLVRKAAHFTEFFVMTVLLCLLSRTVPVQLSVGFSVALIDETIQLFSDRGSSIVDVWIDMSGVFLAIILFVIIRSIKKKAAEAA